MSLAAKVRRLLGPLCILVFWQASDRWGLLNPALVPAPLTAAAALKRLLLEGHLLPDFGATLARMGAGLLLAAIGGTLLGLLVGHVRWLYDVSSDTMDFFRSVPITALYPVFVLVFGVGHLSKIAMVFTACVWVVALNSAYGVLRAGTTRRQMAALFGASDFQIFRLTVIPEALPQTLIGIRIAISYALIVELLCEMFMGSNLGLGQRIIEAYTTYSMPQLWALILVVGAFGLALNRAFVWIENRIAPWSSR